MPTHIGAQREILQRALAITAVPLASCALYLGLMLARVGRWSFPLDDAWIHLTFARNVALRGEMAYVPGQLSAGSTAPLWTLIVAPAFRLPVGPEVWIAVLGILCLGAASWLAFGITARLFPEARGLPWVVALTFALEWHLNWAAFSGMETLFFVALMLLTLYAYLRKWRLWSVGLLGGLLAVTRPEGAALTALMAAHFMATSVGANRQWRPAASSAASLAAGFAVPLLPYAAFNWLVSGTLLPNTFFAKQAEYAAVANAQPFFLNLLGVATATFIGAQALLVPGFLLAVVLMIRERRFDAAILLGWWLAITLAFAIRLPATYQHGRYEMPVLPASLLLGWWGTWRLGHMLAARSAVLGRVAGRAWGAAFALLLLVFWIRGAQAFADDASAMDCIGVQTAQWLLRNTQPGDTLAVHDIGAVGYYLDDRPLVDLAGLITPDVIPFIRDEARLLDYIVNRRVAYVVSSDAWHARMLRDPRLHFLYANGCPAVVAAGGYQIGVYRLEP